MGMLKKLSFFRKSKSSVRPFQPAQDDDDPEIELLEEPELEAVEKRASPPCSPTKSPARSPAKRPHKGSTAPASPLKVPTPSFGAGAAGQASELAAASPVKGIQEEEEEEPTAAAPGPAAKVALPPSPERRVPSPAEDGLRPGVAAPAPTPVRVDSPAQASEQGSTLDFNTPLEDVYATMTDAFGQMVAASLKSSKWDKRSQALKAVSAVLKGLDIQGMAKPGSTGVLGKGLRLRDRTRCWRTSCLLLNHCMRDKVMPVRLAALDLFTDAFSNAEGVAPKEEIHHAAGVLLERLIDGLGDSNLRLHEGARKCVLFVAEGRGLLGLGKVLARLRERLVASPPHGRSAERTKIYFGVLDSVNVLLQHFPGRRAEEDEDDEHDQPHMAEDAWTENDIAPFVIAGMDDSLGVRVRNSAVALAVTMYQTLGGEAMRPVLAQLRPAKQALLKQKFQESEEEGFDDSIEAADGTPLVEDRPRTAAELEGLVVCGVGVKPIPMPMPHLPGIVNEEAEDEEEEYLMDGILEETGAAFSSTAMMQDFAQQQLFANGHRAGLPNFGEAGSSALGRAPGVGIAAAPSRIIMELNALEEEHILLEEELMQMGLDMEGLDEQQALLSSLQVQKEAVERDAGDEVAVLLNSLQGDLSLSSMHSVEVC